MFAFLDKQFPLYRYGSRNDPKEVTVSGLTLVVGMPVLMVMALLVLGGFTPFPKSLAR